MRRRRRPSGVKPEVVRGCSRWITQPDARRCRSLAERHWISVSTPAPERCPPVRSRSRTSLSRRTRGRPKPVQAQVSGDARERYRGAEHGPVLSARREACDSPRPDALDNPAIATIDDPPMSVGPDQSTQNSLRRFRAAPRPELVEAGQSSVHDLPESAQTDEAPPQTASSTVASPRSAVGTASETYRRASRSDLVGMPRRNASAKGPEDHQGLRSTSTVTAVVRLTHSCWTNGPINESSHERSEVTEPENVELHAEQLPRHAEGDGRIGSPSNGWRHEDPMQIVERDAAGNEELPPTGRSTPSSVTFICNTGWAEG